MARFDICPLGDGLVLDVQADLLDTLNTRVIVPLLPIAEDPPAAGRLNPKFTIEGATYLLVPQYLSAVRASELSPDIGTLAAAHDQITAALDMVFQGI